MDKVTRDKLHILLCDSIDKTVDKYQNLGAGSISHNIIEDFLESYIDSLEHKLAIADNSLETVLESGCVPEYLVNTIKCGLGFDVIED